MEPHRLPFPAIVGQDQLKRALLAVAANDDLDGLLVQGEKGTAKSTAVRGLVDLLPDQEAVADCPYGCHPTETDRQCESCRKREAADLPVETRPVPLVTLPLGATRERVVGTLSVADALEGQAEFDPGLLAQANRGILYVDEVNLLEDHLVDVVLDAAASGVNRVERDGVSVTHPANFTLVGTMNPEEGDLRPQLRDRFALQATVAGCRDPEDRVSVIDRALGAGGHDATAGDFADQTDSLRAKLVEAMDLVATVDLPTEFKREIADLCLEAGVDGHRADIAIARTARTFAALDGRTKVMKSDIRDAARLALPHRLQNRPFDDAPDAEDVMDEFFDEEEGTGDDSTEESTTEGDDDEDDRGGDGDDQPTDGGEDESGEGPETGDRSGDSEEDSSESPGPDDGNESTGDSPTQAPTGGSGDSGEADNESTGDSEGGSQETEAAPIVPGQRRASVGDVERPDVAELTVDSAAPGDGSRARVGTTREGRGARVRTEPATTDDPVDAPASVRAAASAGRTNLREDDLRTSVRRARAGALVVFVVDASASMGPAMAEAKGTVMTLLQDAYEQRDEVAFVAVAGEKAETLLPPTDSVTLAARHLKDLPTGDRTPLPSGLLEATRLVTRSNAEASLVVVVTDGRANVSEGSVTARTREAANQLAEASSDVVIVDASDGDTAGMVALLQRETTGRLMPLDDLSAQQVASAAAAANQRESDRV